MRGGRIQGAIPQSSCRDIQNEGATSQEMPFRPLNEDS